MNKKELIEGIQNLESESEDGAYQRGFDSMKYWCLMLASNLDELQTKKVEVPDFVAEWFEENKGDINQAMYNITIDIHGNRHTTEFEKWFSDSRNDTYGTIVRMKDGYTIKPNRWVVKFTPLEVVKPRYFAIDNAQFDITESVWSYYQTDAWKFEDKAKADAMALVLDGSVEEV